MKKVSLLAKTKGIILKRQALSERDILLYILSKEGVVLKCKCYGLRQSRRRSLLSVELANLVSIDYYDHTARKGVSLFYTLKEIKVEKYFSELKKNYSLLCLGSYFLELILFSLSESRETKSSLYLLLEGSLNYLENAAINSVKLREKNLREKNLREKNLREKNLREKNLREKNQGREKETLKEVPQSTLDDLLHGSTQSTALNLVILSFFSVRVLSFLGILNDEKNCRICLKNFDSPSLVFWEVPECSFICKSCKSSDTTVTENIYDYKILLLIRYALRNRFQKYLKYSLSFFSQNSGKSSELTKIEKQLFLDCFSIFNNGLTKALLHFKGSNFKSTELLFRELGL